jgi:hypothetical protein
MHRGKNAGLRLKRPHQAEVAEVVKKQATTELSSEQGATSLVLERTTSTSSIPRLPSRSAVDFEGCMLSPLAGATRDGLPLVSRFLGSVPVQVRSMRPAGHA